jgi:hypothetical protein
MQPENEIVSPIIEALERRASLPFSPMNSDIVIGVLIGCFLLLVFAFGDQSRYLLQLIHNNSIGYSKSADEEIRTFRSFWVRLFLLIQTFVSSGLCITYLLYLRGIATDNIETAKWLVLSTLAMAIYLVLKIILYLIVNVFLFTWHQINAWNRAYTDLFLFFGLGTFVLAVCGIFFEMAALPFITCLVLLIIVIEIALMTKAFQIFFSKKYGYVKLFIYLCALEWMPLLVMGKIFIRYCTTI